MTTIVTDDSAEEQGGFLFAKQKGVLHSKLRMLLCGFHHITQKLADNAHFGNSHVSPTVYDRILSTLQYIARSCETRREAMIVMWCLRTYARAKLTPAKFSKFTDFADKAVATFDRWALFTMITHLFFHVFTSSAVEGLHSVQTRGKNGGWELITVTKCVRVNET